MGPRVTRRISLSPADRSCHWWIVNVAMDASKEASGNGRASAGASIAAGRCEGRCDLIVADGSTAVTCLSTGSYDPAPAPTLSTVSASLRYDRITASIRGSG